MMMTIVRDKDVLMKYLKYSMVIISMLVFLTGCACTGSLSKNEKKEIEDFLIDQEIADEIISVDTIGAGEGEYITYIYNVKKDNEQYQYKIRQIQICDDYRIFEMHKENCSYKDDINLKITSDGEVSIVEKESDKN